MTEKRTRPAHPWRNGMTKRGKLPRPTLDLDDMGREQCSCGVKPGSNCPRSPGAIAPCMSVQHFPERRHHG